MPTVMAVDASWRWSAIAPPIPDTARHRRTAPVVEQPQRSNVPVPTFFHGGLHPCRGTGINAMTGRATMTRRVMTPATRGSRGLWVSVGLSRLRVSAQHRPMACWPAAVAGQVRAHEHPSCGDRMGPQNPRAWPWETVWGALARPGERPPSPPHRPTDRQCVHRPGRALDGQGIMPVPDGAPAGGNRMGPPAEPQGMALGDSVGALATPGERPPSPTQPPTPVRPQPCRALDGQASCRRPPVPPVPPDAPAGGTAVSPRGGHAGCCLR